MKKFSYLIMFLAVLVFASGLSGCKKESNDDPPKPTPTPVKPKPDPEKPEEKPAAQQLYNEALNDIKQSHDYTTAVQKLTQAAEQNADSANLVLAYMYEYGVGVEQDIAKAKEYYAKESSAHNNEFATEKLALLNEDANNCKLVLPDGCNLHNNEVFLVCGDSITMANGDGSFNTLSNIIIAKNADNKPLSFCYRHPSCSEQKVVSALETATTLMLCAIPYAFDLDESSYNIITKEIIQLEETQKLAAEIEKQIVEQGFYDIMSLTTYLQEGYAKIYNSFNKPNVLTKKGVEETGTVNGAGQLISQNSALTLSIHEKNDIKTSFKSGIYNNKDYVWDVTLNVKNMSLLPIVVMPGTYDETGTFVEKDFWSNFRFVGCKADVVDMGGSIIGCIRSNINYFKMFYDRRVEERNNSRGISGVFEDFGETQRRYREQFMKVETDIDLKIETTRDALRYYYPFCGTSRTDYLVDAYYVIYNLVIPIYEIVKDEIKKDKKQTDTEDKHAALDIALNALKMGATDEEWIASFNVFINKVASDEPFEFIDRWDDIYKPFFVKTMGIIMESVWEYIVDYYATIQGLPDKQVKKSTKAGKETAKLAYKVYDKGADAGRIVDAMASAEKVFIDDLPGVKEFLTSTKIANEAVGILFGIFDRVWRDYSTYDINFSFAQPNKIIKSELVKDSEGNPKSILFQVNKLSTIEVYINDELVHTEKDFPALSLFTYDLTDLEPGDYNVQIDALIKDPTEDYYELKSYVVDFTLLKTPILEIDEPVGLSSLFFVDPDDDPCLFLPCNLGDDMSINITSSILCDISVLVNGKEVGSKNSTKEYSVSLPTDQPGTFKVVVKGKTEYTESPDILFTYAVTKPDTPVTPSGSLPTVSGTSLESTTSHSGGAAPDVKGQNIDQTYSTGTAPDVKGQNLDDSYSGHGTAPDAKGQKL